MASDAQFHIEENARVAKLAHLRMMRTGGLETLYLYYKIGAKHLKVFAEGEDINRDEYVLAFAERLPTNLDLAQLTRWLKERTDSVPYL